MTMFHKVLIANRGEIALRIIRSAKAMGFQTVAVYSDADRNSACVSAADEAVYIGASAAEHSYLNIDSVLAAATRCQATMVHPGYGFLSENADFARACETAGLVFVGPPADVIEKMGSKRAAKLIAQSAGIACIPGYEGDEQTIERFAEQAELIGYPVMVKASFGGGGRGMRLVSSEAQLAENFTSAKSEAQSSFGDDELILEKALVNARHIEIQLFADGHGHVIHLGERDCSVQRRHQKVLEESPSPFVSSQLRESMGAVACQLAIACGYVGAGTVEFMVDGDGTYYFLEMNTRLQVEHPVTELVTGTDLVAMQFQVACGETLALQQSDVCFNGVAIEMRLYAEDADNNFIPQAGRITRWQPPSREGIRVDHALAEGDLISVYYDPMLAKIIAHGVNREVALRRLYAALNDTRLLGLKTNKAYVMDLLTSEPFARGDYHTGLVASLNIDRDPVSAEQSAAAIAAIIVDQSERAKQARARIAEIPRKLVLKSPEKYHSIELLAQPAESSVHYGASLAERNIEIGFERLTDEHCDLVIDGVRRQVPYSFVSGSLCVELNNQQFSFQQVTYLGANQSTQANKGTLVAQMSGVIVNVLFKPGDTVQADQTLIVMESMKMEHQLLAGIDGVIEALQVKAGDTVSAQQLLARVVKAA